MGKPTFSLAALALSLALGGCALTPYEEEFACPGTGNFGKCATVNAAYDEALTGRDAGPRMKPGGTDEERAQHRAEAAYYAAQGVEGAPPSYSEYRQRVYKTLGAMLEQPPTPMVKNPEVVRVLILSYPKESAGNPLFMPRFVYFFGAEPQWVLGEYLRPDQRRLSGPTVKFER